MLSQLRGFVAKAPAETVLIQSLKRRITTVQGLDAAQADKALARATRIAAEEVFPAYHHQIGVIAALQAKAVHDGGIWRLKDGDQFYATALRAYTTSTTPDEIHDMGVELVALFNGEMDAILRRPGHDAKGSVAERVARRSRAARAALCRTPTPAARRSWPTSTADRGTSSR